MITKPEIAENEQYQEYIDLGVTMQCVSSNLTLYANTILKKFKLTFQQYNVLRILDKCYPESVTVKYISLRMIDRNSNASRLVEKLVQKKFVTREISLTDKRSVNINITQQGIDALNLAAQTLEPIFYSEMSARMTLDEAKLANTLLLKLKQ